MILIKPQYYTHQKSGPSLIHCFFVFLFLTYKKTDKKPINIWSQSVLPFNSPYLVSNQSLENVTFSLNTDRSHLFLYDFSFFKTPSRSVMLSQYKILNFLSKKPIIPRLWYMNPCFFEIASSHRLPAVSPWAARW